MKIGILMRTYPSGHKSPITLEMSHLLSEWGATVDPIYPEEQLINLARLRVEHDLYIIKSGSEIALSLAGALHVLGARILNPYPALLMLRDKIVATQVLRAAGVPIPEIYIAGHPGQLAPLSNSGPLIVKPYRGSQGQGIRVIQHADQLSDLKQGREPVFAQSYLKSEGFDHKVYCIGTDVFGVKRVWPPRTYEEKLGEPFTITHDVREIALHCGQAFGIKLYGLDIIISNGQPYVVDINNFPGFKGVPDAALRLADYIYTTGQRILDGEPLVSTVYHKEALI
ncbi:MAG: hypothetical protein BA865_15585 [Desulfobacterales bacterium S5133MH4]|nr:MAG: hypothetical protein BA865_15585 [Desulfobacterales bacterium S5133MH4]